MSRKILAGTTLVMAIAMTTGAMALDQGNAGRSRFAGVRGLSEWRQGGWSSHGFVGGHGRAIKGAYSGAGHYTDLGPLGVRFGDYAPGAGYGSSIAAWSR